MRPRRRGLLLAAAGLLALALACAGARGWARRNAVAASIPARPDLSAMPAELDSELASAEASARGYLGPVAGLVALSRLYHANGFYGEAMRCYSGLRRLEPGEGRWPHLEASILAQFGRQDEALPREQEAVELAPGYLPARLRLGDELLNANRLPEASAAYNAVLERSAANPYALLGLAKCEIQGGDWAQARDHLERAIKASPDFVGGLWLLSTVDEHFGRQADADALKRIIADREFVDLADPWMDGLMDDCYDPYRLSVAAAVALAAGKSAEAKGMLERAIAFAPTASAYHRQLARIYSREGDVASAREHFERAVAVSPTDNDAWLLLSQLLTQAGDKTGAERTLAAGLANCPQSYGLHLEHGRQLEADGRHEAAIAEFRESNRLNPAEIGPLVQLAAALFAVNRDDEGLAALHEALARQPESPFPLSSLMFYYISSGDEATALTWWAHVRRQARMPVPTLDALRQAYRSKFGRELE